MAADDGDAEGGGLSYRAAGVDIEAGDALVRAIAPVAKATHRTGVVGGLGGFGALFDVRAAGFRDPLLVAATDGVGTKLKVAIAAGRHHAIGIDLVAMCANDLVVQGATPLFFLDYYASERLDVALGTEIVQGIAAGCRQAGCALIGGETAEMPGLYADGDYDLAGFCVGAVERDAVLPRADMAAGDVVLGLASDGLHANGFSLVRRVVRAAGLDYGDAAPFAPGLSLGEALLAPTRIYVPGCLAALAPSAGGGGIKGLAHITGGGLTENLPRILPDGLAADLDAAAWPVPPVFRWLKDQGGIASAEMYRTFNAGIGMAVVCAAGDRDRVTEALTAAGETVHAMGRLVTAADDAGPRVRIGNGDAPWRG